jgi:mortality factor 4-like protein 1
MRAEEEGTRRKRTRNVDAVSVLGEEESWEFRNNDIVLAFHGPLLYEARVLKRAVFHDAPCYFLHYTGWAKKWDEWVGLDRIKARTKENLDLMKRLVVNEKAKKSSILRFLLLSSFCTEEGSKKTKDSEDNEKKKKKVIKLDFSIPEALHAYMTEIDNQIRNSNKVRR